MVSPFVFLKRPFGSRKSENHIFREKKEIFPLFLILTFTMIKIFTIIIIGVVDNVLPQPLPTAAAAVIIFRCDNSTTQ
jgi:hypothetical protein